MIVNEELSDLFSPGPIYSGPVSAAGWTVPDQDISEQYRNTSAELQDQSESFS